MAETREDINQQLSQAQIPYDGLIVDDALLAEDAPLLAGQTRSEITNI